MIIINMICVLISIYIFIKIFNREISAAYICLVLFDVSFVVPLLIESILGTPYLRYPGFELAKADWVTNLLYAFFVLAVEFMFYFHLRKKKKRMKTFSLTQKFVESRNVLAQNRMLGVISVFLMLLPLFVVLLAPTPTVYFNIGAFAMKTVEVTTTEVMYHNEVALSCRYIVLAGIVLSKICDVRGKKTLAYLRTISTVFLTLIDGKRTLYVFIIIILLAIDWLSAPKKKDKLIMKTVFIVAVAAIYFVAYAYITGKYEYNTDWYAVISEYFFRSNAVKAALFSLIHPEQIQILDYPFQTFLYDLFYFVPRSIWINKPYPYALYYSSAVYGYTTLTDIGWRFQAGWYAECISNLGLIGIIIGPWMVLKFCDLIDGSKSIISNVIGLFFILFIQVFEYSDMLKICLIVFIVLRFKETFFRRKIRFKWRR